MAKIKTHSSKLHFWGNIDFTTGNLFWKIILFALPVILTSLIQLFYSSSDLFVVAHWGGGNYSMAAVGDNGSLINLIVNTFVGISVGANVVVAKCKGMNDQETANKAMYSSFYIAIVLGIFVGIIGYFNAGTFLAWMNTPKEIIDLATIYLKIYFLGVPFLMLYNFGAAILRGVGDSARPLFALIICGAINVGLNFLFVMVFEMDVAGVAITTVISEFLEDLILLFFFLDKRRPFLHFSLKEMKLDLPTLWEVLKNGIPAGAEVFVFSISNVIIQSAANTFSASVIAGNTASDNVEGYLYAFLEAFAVSVTSVASQNFGAGKKENLKKSLTYSLLIILCFGFVLGALFVLLRQQLISLFVVDTDAANFSYKEAMEAGTSRLFLMGSLCFLCSTMDCFSGFLRGIGHAIAPTVVTIICALLMRLIYVFVFFYHYQALQNIVALYASYPISWALACLAYLFIVPPFYKKALAAIDARPSLLQKKAQL